MEEHGNNCDCRSCRAKRGVELMNKAISMGLGDQDGWSEETCLVAEKLKVTGVCRRRELPIILALLELGLAARLEGRYVLTDLGQAAFA